MTDWRRRLSELDRTAPDREAIRKRFDVGSHLPDPVEARREPRIVVIAVAAVVAIAGLALVFSAFRNSPSLPPAVPAASSASPASASPASASPTIGSSEPPCPFTDSPALGDTATSFDTACLAIVANQPTTIDVKVADDGLQHSVLVCSDKDCNQASQIASTDVKTGPTLLVLDLPGLDPGTYFFEDPVHPVNSNGTLYVVEGS